MKYLTSNSLNDPKLHSKLSCALLCVRLLMGFAFILHGWPKIQNAFTWMGPDAPIPGFLQGLAAFAEFAGGITLILGLLTSLTSLGLLITMTVAALFHIQKGDPFVGRDGSWELAGIYLVLSLLFLLLGPGNHSLDAKLFKK